MTGDCSECKHYNSIPKMQQQIEYLSKEDKNQKMILKEIGDSVGEIKLTLNGHMKWEEFFQKVMVGGMLLIAPVAIAYMGWQFLEHTSKKEVAAKHDERILSNKESVEKLYVRIDDMKKSFKDDLSRTVSDINRHNTDASKKNYAGLARVIRDEIKKRNRIK
jgi:N-glycosylase/DNA lyase